jgi:homoserine O-acetyltransferase
VTSKTAEPIQAAITIPDSHELTEGVLALPGPLTLHFGGRLDSVEIAYRLTGARNAPVVLVLGGISSGSNVCVVRSSEFGWWDEMVGPGKSLDTDRYRILGIDWLGGGHRSTGPSRGASFPSISAYDQVECLAALLQHLEVPRLWGTVGASYGGMVALALAERKPELAGRIVIFSAAHRTHPMSTAWRSVQRNIVRYAITHGEGPRGLVLARALAMATYRTAREFEERFATGLPQPAPGGEGFVFPVEQYLMSRGESYAVHYRPEAFVCLSESIDLHRVEPERIRTHVTVIGVEEDQLVPLSDIRELRDRLAGTCQLLEISSIYGHDAFLKETAVLREVFAQSLD